MEKGRDRRAQPGRSLYERLEADSFRRRDRGSVRDARVDVVPDPLGQPHQCRQFLGGGAVQQVPSDRVGVRRSYGVDDPVLGERVTRPRASILVG